MKSTKIEIIRWETENGPVYTAKSQNGLDKFLRSIGVEPSGKCFEEDQPSQQPPHGSSLASRKHRLKSNRVSLSSLHANDRPTHTCISHHKCHIEHQTCLQEICTPCLSRRWSNLREKLQQSQHDHTCDKDSK